MAQLALQTACGADVLGCRRCAGSLLRAERESFLNRHREISSCRGARARNEDTTNVLGVVRSPVSGRSRATLGHFGGALCAFPAGKASSCRQLPSPSCRSPNRVHNEIAEVGTT